MALLLVLLVVFFVVLDYVEYIDDFLDRGASMRQIFGTYYLHYIPEIVKLTSPLAVFLATIYTTARLSQSMQLAALTTAGVSLYRVLRPFALAGVLVYRFIVFFGFIANCYNISLEINNTTAFNPALLIPQENTNFTTILTELINLAV